MLICNLPFKCSDASKRLNFVTLDTFALDSQEWTWVDEWHIEGAAGPNDTGPTSKDCDAHVKFSRYKGSIE